LGRIWMSTLVEREARHWIPLLHTYGRVVHHILSKGVGFVFLDQGQMLERRGCLDQAQKWIAIAILAVGPSTHGQGF